MCTRYHWDLPLGASGMSSVVCPTICDTNLLKPVGVFIWTDRNSNRQTNVEIIKKEEVSKVSLSSRDQCAVGRSSGLFANHHHHHHHHHHPLHRHHHPSQNVDVKGWIF